MALFSWLKNRRYERAGFTLYTAAVQAARDPLYYQALGVPDTLDGRFDLVGLFAAILIHRLRALPPPGGELAQAVFDAMFADMDFNLRELGVSDLSVGKRMRDMWEAFHGRALAYEAPLAGDDAATLAAALARNVWRGTPPGDSASALAGVALAQARALAAQTVGDLAQGRIRFLAARDALGEALPA